MLQLAEKMNHEVPNVAQKAEETTEIAEMLLAALRLFRDSRA